MSTSQLPPRTAARPRAGSVSAPRLHGPSRVARWVAALASLLVSLGLTGAVLLGLTADANGPLWSALPACAVLA